MYFTIPVKGVVLAAKLECTTAHNPQAKSVICPRSVTHASTGEISRDL